MARVLIDGPPGCGKSTTATHAADLLRERGEPVFGFTTSEIRRGGRRTGFTVTGVASGRERVLAVRGGDGPRVGTYGVDVGAFEEIALIEIENGLELDATLIIDEMGKMELLSSSFSDLVPAIFDAPRWLICAQRPPHPAIERFIDRASPRRIGLPRPDRAELPQVVVGWLLEEDVARHSSR